MANRRNFFSAATTINELNDQFDSMTSPENLYADGERTRKQANARYLQLQSDFTHRESEIRLAELNALRGTPAN